jgi:hypothetical protein
VSILLLISPTSLRRCDSKESSCELSGSNASARGADAQLSKSVTRRVRLGENDEGRIPIVFSDQSL